MSEGVELRPGHTPLGDWQAVYRGAPVTLDLYARPDVEAGAAALKAILARDDPPRMDADAPSVAELMRAEGDPLPQSLVRLFVALKLGSLAQGLTGMRWKAIHGIADFLAAGLLPTIPAEGASDRLALAHLFAALTGMGEVVSKDRRRPAAKALKKAKLPPLDLKAEERGALLSGTELSTAAALAGLFEAERVFRAALIAAALSAAALQRPGEHPRVPRLYRHPGQLEAAAALRALGDAAVTGEAEAAAASDADEAVGSVAPLQLGSCLDLLRQAGATLERAANSVTESPLVFWQSGELVSGAEDSSAAARAADLVALALGTLGDLSRARTAALTRAGAAEGSADAASPEASASNFAARIREHADATSDNRRLLPMAGTAALVVAIEILTAARLCEAEQEGVGAPLDGVLDLVREAAPHFATGQSAAGELAAIADRVSSGALVAAAGVALPGLAPQTRKRR